MIHDIQDMTSSSRKHKAYSMVEKLKFIKEIEGGKPLTQVSKDECIPKSTLGTWLKGKEKIMEAVSKGKVNVKRDRQACNQRVDEAQYSSGW